MRIEKPLNSIRKCLPQVRKATMRCPISRALSIFALPVALRMRSPANDCVRSRKMTSVGPSGTKNLDLARYLVRTPTRSAGSRTWAQDIRRESTSRR